MMTVRETQNRMALTRRDELPVRGMVHRLLASRLGRLLAAQVCAAVLLAGVPAILALRGFHVIGGGATAMLLPALLLAASVTGQIATTGTWVPERWNAVLCLMVALCQVATVAWLAVSGEWGWFLAAVAALLLSMHAARQIGLNWRFNGWRSSRDRLGLRHAGPEEHGLGRRRAFDDDQTMPA